MNTGKLVRLNRIFSHPSGHLCSVAIDHFINYGAGLPAGLRHIQTTLTAIVEARPDAVTMHKGLAASAWKAHAGQVPLILQSMIGRPDGTPPEILATPEDAVRLGADAFAVAAFVRGPAEMAYLRLVSEFVREAARFEMPVICHIYPRDLSTPKGISYAPEDIAWAVRCATEVGADVIKTPYCGEVAAYSEIIADCPVPVVAAGGPQTGSLVAALEMMAAVMQSGGRGATIGRNVWGVEDTITQAVNAFKAVIHEGASPQEALEIAS